jgi:hypothetical protein
MEEIQMSKDMTHCNFAKSKTVIRKKMQRYTDTTQKIYDNLLDLHHLCTPKGEFMIYNAQKQILKDTMCGNFTGAVRKTCEEYAKSTSFIY